MDASTRLRLRDLALAEDKAAHFGLRKNAINYPRFLVVRRAHGGAGKIYVRNADDYRMSIDEDPEVIEVLNDAVTAKIADVLVQRYTPRGFSSPRSF